MQLQKKLEISLFIIRITSGLFFLVWSAEKIFRVESAQNVFSQFYFVNISPVVMIAIGIFQAIIVFLFMTGIFKVWTYGILLGIHSVSTLATYKQLLNPYEESNPLFWAAVPTLAALIALFLLRKEDNLFVLSGNQQKDKNPDLERIA